MRRKIRIVAVRLSGISMAPNPLERHLAELEAARYRFGRNEAARVVKLLNRLDASRFSDPGLLIRFHETLLFLRAFPQGPAVMRATERILNRFHKKVEALHESDVDMDIFDTFEDAGIAGTQMEDTLSFDVAKWLVKRMPREVGIAWENYEPGRDLGTTGPRFIPLLDDDADVEADTPWRDWMEAAASWPLLKSEKGRTPSGSESGKKKGAVLAWLISRFDQLPLPPRQKAELYDSLRVPLRWNLENSLLSRTRNYRPVRKLFYHTEPLITRSQVSLAEELAKRPPRLAKVSRKHGEEVMELIREVMLVRYRELYGTTFGDPKSVVRADVGRGVTIYLWNLPPDRRLPLRAYVAGLTLKNGVPINYIEAIGLCEWMEVGFNTFYTFRGGEAGWIYAQVLRCLCHLMGATCVSVYPYQLGKDNEEAIESGAFWFYRKLGFRPGRPDLQRLAEREESRIAADPRYRTPAKTLRRLASDHAFYELPGSAVGAWDRFSTRNIGLRVNRKMAREFQGDAEYMREESTQLVARALNVNMSSWRAADRASFEKFFKDFAVVLSMCPGLASWTREEKEGLLRVLRSKAKRDEMLYLHLTQAHARLRDALLKLGSD
jgi:hypothetical protein